MKHIIEGTTLPILTITMNKGESIYSSSGSLVAMSESIKLSTEMVGGVTKAIRRLAGKESAFLTRFIAQEDNAVVSFSDGNVPGTTKSFYLDGTKELICERASFLCCESTVDLDITFLRKVSAGIFGGEGFVFLKLSGVGHVFLHPYGEIKEYTLMEKEKLFISTGNVVAFENTVQFNVVFMKKLRNIIFSREGLFITEMIGPGKVWVQSTTNKER